VDALERKKKKKKKKRRKEKEREMGAKSADELLEGRGADQKSKKKKKKHRRKDEEEEEVGICAFKCIVIYERLQCFDAVAWAAGRASGL